MDIREILKHVDHTLLTVTATRSEIRSLCDDAMRFGTASVCIPACYVEDAKRYVGDRMRVCTVIGFPNGYDTSASKAFMAADAIAKGADEIDMVINQGWVQDEKYSDVEAEIAMVKEACGDRILKVIVETCNLNEEQKIRMCGAVTAAGADYIKTSTGFGSGGAVFEDVELFARYVGPGVRIKAAGGISSMADAEKFLELGADRLGTSRIVKIAKQMEASGN
ncbi:MAG: deoxyribose-phosphate aldolase [Lachnospiraceae bacterium]|nr:deoxyribose-phosphate aldolase [Lachnospiraceae bacterium]